MQTKKDTVCYRLGAVAVAVTLFILTIALFGAIIVAGAYSAYGIYQKMHPEYDYSTGCLKTGCGSDMAMCYDGHMVQCYVLGLAAVLCLITVAIFISCVIGVCVWICNGDSDESESTEPDLDETNLLN